MAEKKGEEKKGITVKIPRINPWIISTLVILVILLVVLVSGWTITGKVVSSNGLTGTLTSKEAANKAINWLTSYFEASGADVKITLINASETANGIYQFTIKLSSTQGENTATYYVTEDGKLFLPQALETEKLVQAQAPETPTEIPKTDKPVVQLFVMSFCPYGTQAESAMKPVVDLLGSKASIEPHFIVSVSGDTVNSLHGSYEANEDMRQACIWKNYGQATFWTYVDYINNNCNSGNIDTCWKDAAKEANVDTTKIENCVKDEGLTLMKAEETLSNQNGVSGSPTLIINGARYNGARTPDAYKDAICSAFTTQPSECSETLSASGTTASGNC